VNDVLTEVRFWSQVIGDARCTVLCCPDLESRIKGWVGARGMGGVITVEASPSVPADRILVVDQAAIQWP
jgi:hypothetical protein